MKRTPHFNRASIGALRSLSPPNALINLPVRPIDLPIDLLTTLRHLLGGKTLVE